MRVWSLHPKYLDSKGLVALWRETLLAQNVLLGKTVGYKNHPQLQRFKEHKSPVDAIGAYLLHVYDEAKMRGYNFNSLKIISSPEHIEKIPVTNGQLEYELSHLKKKLMIRDIATYNRIQEVALPEPHSLFYVVDGEVEKWEMM